MVMQFIILLVILRENLRLKEYGGWNPLKHITCFGCIHFNSHVTLFYIVIFIKVVKSLIGYVSIVIDKFIVNEHILIFPNDVREDFHFVMFVKLMLMHYFLLYCF